MANIGFNPMPNISLGDMEDIFDIENELAILSDEEQPQSGITSQIDKDKIVKQFMLDSLNENSSLVVEKSEEIEDDFIIEDDDLGDLIGSDESEDDTSDEADNNDLDFDIDEDELSLEIGDDEPEVQVTNTSVKNESIDDKEAELLRRIKAAEEAKKAERERVERLKKLEEEARLAEQEAEIARKKREAEQAKLEEEKRLQQLKLERQRKEAELQQLEAEKLKQARLREQQELDKKEKEEQEKIRQLLLLKKKREQEEKAKSAKNSSINSLKSSIQTKTVNETSDYIKYDNLDIDALYGEVRKFLKLHNVEKKIIDIKILENEFGKANIKKLILKSYLISIGKGVTVGR